MCWSWKRSLGFPVGAVWNILRTVWKNRNAVRMMRSQKEVPMLVLVKTWEDLLAGHPVLLQERIVQLVVGRGLVFTPPSQGGA